MSQSTRQAPTSATVALRDALAQYRHVCLLRHQGRAVEADRLETDIVEPALAQITSDGGVSVGDIEAALQKERHRVDEAALLASLLTPMVVAQMGTTSANGQSTSATGKSLSPPKTRPSTPASIAGFIDEMLTNQNSTRNP